MPHGLTILTATMTGGLAGAPAAANTAGCCCPWCPSWCAACCPAWCTTAAPAAAPLAGVSHAAAPAAYAPAAGIPAAYAPAGSVPAASPLPVNVPSSLPGGWGSAGGPLPPVSYPASTAGGVGYYSGNPPALTGAMSLFAMGRDRAGQLLKQARDSAMAWGSGSEEPEAGDDLSAGAAGRERVDQEETKKNDTWSRNSRSSTTASSGDRQNNAPRWNGRTVRRSDSSSRSSPIGKSSTDNAVFCEMAVEEDMVRRGSHASVFL